MKQIIMIVAMFFCFSLHADDDKKLNCPSWVVRHCNPASGAAQGAAQAVNGLCQAMARLLCEEVIPHDKKQDDEKHKKRRE